MAVSSAIDASAVARVVGIKTEFVDLRQNNVVFLPQRIAVVGQGASSAVYSTDKRQVTNAVEAGSLYGFGSPVHLAVKELLPLNGDGVGTIPVTIYPLEDDVSGLPSTGDITPTVAQTEAASYIVRVNNIDSNAFVISVGDTVADVVTAITEAINANLDMPIIATDNATDVQIVSKWAGTSANGISIEIIGSTTAGTTFAITQPTGGLVNPDVDDALNQVGDVWETIFLNCLEIGDTTSLDKYNTFGEGRWSALVRKPSVVFTGNTEPTVALATVVSDARKTDRVNGQLVLPGSNDLPFLVAARQIARIAVVANNNPPRDYGSQDASGLTPSADGEQWTYLERDQAVKLGSSTIEVKDGVPNISDVVTFYHPTGEQIPPYRYVVDIVKLQNIIFNLNLIFANSEWDGAPLIPDGQPTTNRSAKRPDMAKAEVNRLIDNLALNAILSDPATAKAATIAAINTQNPKRLDICMQVQLSGNVNIISVDLKFGFFFGTAPIIT